MKKTTLGAGLAAMLAIVSTPLLASANNYRAHVNGNDAGKVVRLDAGLTSSSAISQDDTGGAEDVSRGGPGAAVIGVSAAVLIGIATYLIFRDNSNDNDQPKSA